MELCSISFMFPVAFVPPLILDICIAPLSSKIHFDLSFMFPCVVISDFSYSSVEVDLI